MAARPRQVTDEEILKTATDCFLTLGVGVSTQVIADRLNISQPALFKRFSTKEELMLKALLPPERPAILDWLNAGPAEGPIKPQFEVLLKKLWKMVCFVIPRVSVLTSSGIDYDNVVKCYQKFPLVSMFEELAGWLGRAQERGEILQLGNPLSLAQACLGPLQGRALLRFVLGGALSMQMSTSGFDTDEENDAYVSLVTTILWRAIGIEKS